MINVTQTHDSGYTVYSFEANNTDYQVLTDDGKVFQVYSSRHGLTGRTAPKVYNSLEEMAKRSDAFNSLSILIAATMEAAKTLNKSN